MNTRQKNDPVKLAGQLPAFFKRGAKALSIIALLSLLLIYAGCRQKEPASDKHGITYNVAGRNIDVSSWKGELPADIILAIDQSGSMSKGKHPTDPSGVRLQGSHAFLEFVAGRATKEIPNRFGVVNFGTEAPAKYAAPMISIASLEDQAIGKIASRLVPLDLGDTNFTSALQRAAQILREAASTKEPRNQAVVIFTDGEPDDPRKLTVEKYFREIGQTIEKDLKPKGIDVFIIGIDSPGTRWRSTVSLWQRLLGDDHVFTTPTMEALKSQLNRIVQRIWHIPEVEPVMVSSQSPVEFDVEPYLAVVEFHIFPGRKGLSLRIFRPDESVLKPGQDPDTPPVKNLSTFDRIVVHEPAPGRWRYEVVGGTGTIEVLRNPIPLRMQLVSPSPVHPQGKPMLLTAEFKRTDGKSVIPHPDYPLGLAADVETPAGKKIPVKFPLENGTGGVFTGEPRIDDTASAGKYPITLKVSGGGRYQTRQPVDVQVKSAPYLQIEQPLHAAPLPLNSAVSVRVRLLQAGKSLRPQDVFSNHPDFLVIAQMIQDPGGRRGQAVWLSHAKEAGVFGQFDGVVPLLEKGEGRYELAVKLAPEEQDKQKTADQCVVTFLMQRPPRPAWLIPSGLALLALTIFSALAWHLRRFYLMRLKFPFYYWVEDEAVWRVISLDRPDQIAELIGIPLRVKRLGKQKAVRFEPLTGAKLLTGDGQERPSVDAFAGGRILVRKTPETIRAVTFDFGKPPPHPEPFGATESIGEPSQEKPSQKADETDWGFGKTTD